MEIEIVDRRGTCLSENEMGYEIECACGNQK